MLRTNFISSISMPTTTIIAYSAAREQPGGGAKGAEALHVSQVKVEKKDKKF